MFLQRYTETLDTTSTIQTRRIQANGCPNHYTTCTGKSGVSTCGGVGESGSGTEAKVSTKDKTIPLHPVLRDSYATDDTTAAITKCTLGVRDVCLFVFLSSFKTIN